jgi:hypothetical protein
MGARTVGATLLAVLLALTPACSESPSAPSPELRGGVLATFAVEGERFSVWITDPADVHHVLALQRDQSLPGIPNGRLRRGAGQGNHNAPFTWHLDPADIEFADVTIELCDGSPSYVQAHLDEYVDRVERYCPWSARLVSVVDYR